MKFQILIGSCLNQKTISLQETAQCNTYFLPLLLRLPIDPLKRSIQQSPHFLLVSVRPVRLIQVFVEFFNFICIQYFVSLDVPIQITDIRRRYRFKQNRILVKRFKCFLDILIFVFEVQNKGRLIVRRTDSVQP